MEEDANAQVVKATKPQMQQTRYASSALSAYPAARWIRSGSEDANRLSARSLHRRRLLAIAKLQVREPVHQKISHRTIIVNPLCHDKRLLCPFLRLNIVF